MPGPVWSPVEDGPRRKLFPLSINRAFLVSLVVGLVNRPAKTVAWLGPVGTAGTSEGLAEANQRAWGGSATRGIGTKIAALATGLRSYWTSSTTAMLGTGEGWPR